MGSMNSIPASSASCARRILLSQELTQRSGTFVTDIPPEQFAEKNPSLRALSFRMGDCLRPICTSRGFPPGGAEPPKNACSEGAAHYDTTKCLESDGQENERSPERTGPVRDPWKRKARNRDSRSYDRWILRPRWYRFVVLERFNGQRYGFFKLRVMSLDDEIRALGHDIVRIHAVLLDDPFSTIVRTPETEPWRRDEAAVPQRLHVADPH